MRSVQDQYFTMPSIVVSLPDTKSLEHVVARHKVSTINLLKLAWSFVAEQFISSDAFQFQISHEQDAVSTISGHSDYSDIGLCFKIENSDAVKSTLIADLLRENSGIAVRNEDTIQSITSQVEEPVIPEQRIWSKLQIVLKGNFELNNPVLIQRFKGIKEDNFINVLREKESPA